jgi:hypothetical protein
MPDGSGNNQITIFRAMPAWMTATGISQSANHIDKLQRPGHGRMRMF